MAEKHGLAGHCMLSDNGCMEFGEAMQGLEWHARVPGIVELVQPNTESLVTTGA